MIAIPEELIANGRSGPCRLDYVMECVGVMRSQGRYIAKVVNGETWATGLSETPCQAVRAALTTPFQTGKVKS